MADDMRFSDEHLHQLKKDFEEHKAEQEKRWQELADMVAENTAATKSLAESVQSIAKSTEGVVRLYADFKGAARVGVGLQKFIAWVAALGTAGAFIAGIIVWVLDKVSPA